MKENLWGTTSQKFTVSLIKNTECINFTDMIGFWESKKYLVILSEKHSNSSMVSILTDVLAYASQCPVAELSLGFNWGRGRLRF